MEADMFRRFYGYMKDYRKYGFSAVRAWLWRLCSTGDSAGYGGYYRCGRGKRRQELHYHEGNRDVHTGAYSAGAWRRVFQICGAVRPGAGSGAQEGGVSEDPELFFFQYRSFYHFLPRYEAYQRCDGDSERCDHWPQTRRACSRDMVTALCLSFSINARLALIFLVAAPLLGDYPVYHHQPCEAAVFQDAEER